MCVLWCREALLGTDAGVVYELSVDEGKKERLRQLHELHGGAGPIAGLAQVRSGSQSASNGYQQSSSSNLAASPVHVLQLLPAVCPPPACSCPLPAAHCLLQIALSPERRLVLALCGARLHAFAGGPSLEALFMSYSADRLGGLDARYIDLPTQAGAAQLQLLYPPKQPDPAALLDAAAGAGGGGPGSGSGASGSGSFEMPRPEVFAVLSPSGIYYGRLDLDPGIADAADHLVKHHLLPAAVLHMPSQQQQPHLQQQQQRQAEAPAERPLSVVSAALSGISARAALCLCCSHASSAPPPK